MPAALWWSQTFVNDGGPLIALPHESLHHWQGTADEYRQACDARRPFDVFKSSRQPVLIAASEGEMIYVAQWLRLADQPGAVFVGWESGGDDEPSQDWLEFRLSQADVPWQPRSWRMNVPSGVLLLAHAAGPAAGVRLTPPERPACVGDVVPVGIKPGRYALATATLEERPYEGVVYRCVLCGWFPIATARERRSTAAAAARLGQSP